MFHNCTEITLGDGLIITSLTPGKPVFTRSGDGTLKLTIDDNGTVYSDTPLPAWVEIVSGTWLVSEFPKQTAEAARASILSGSANLINLPPETKIYYHGKTIQASLDPMPDHLEGKQVTDYVRRRKSWLGRIIQWIINKTK